MSVNSLFASDGSLWSVRALDISGNYGQRIDLSSNNTINFNTSSTNRLRITDASSIFLNSVDLSANTLLNVNNLTVSRARPQTDASYNFTIVRISTDASARDIAIPSPYNGQLCLLLNSSILQLYNNGNWSRLAGLILNEVAISNNVGGTTATTYLDSNFNSVASPVSNGYTVIKLTCTSNTTNATFTLTPSQAISASYLLVGGGGAGSSSNGGGGGGGGVLTGTTSLTQSTSYNVTKR